MAGQLGTGNMTSSAMPVRVLGSAGGPPFAMAAELAAGDQFTCARTLDASMNVWCWGDNSFGQLGSGGGSSKTVPTAVGMGGALHLSAGVGRACIDVNDEFLTAWCWGNVFLGDGTSNSSPTPVQVSRAPNQPYFLPQVQNISAGGDHCCALTTTGGTSEDAVNCFGHNQSGAVGDGTRMDRNGAVVVKDASGNMFTAVSVAAGYGHTCAAKMDGSAWCWGSNTYGQLGTGSSMPDAIIPQRVVLAPGGAPLEGVVELGGGFGHTCARTSDGHLFCWGDNTWGQLGVATPAMSSNAVETPFSKVAQLAVGQNHTCIRTDDSVLLCFGTNAAGQLGDGTVSPAPHPGAAQVALSCP